MIFNTRINHHLPKRRHKDYGYVLITVVVTISILAAISLMITRDASMGINLIASSTETTTNDNVTHAALQHTLWQMNNKSCTTQTNLTSRTFGDHSYQASITTNGSGTTNNYTVLVDKDTYLDEKFPDNNFGASFTLGANNAAGQSKRPLYRFNLSAIPAGSTVVSAIARFYISTPDTDGPVAIHAITSLWSETGATWNNMATKYKPLSHGLIKQNPSRWEVVEVDLTALTQAWLNGRPNFGVMLIPSSYGSVSGYTSREYGAIPNVPWLEVTTTSGVIPTRADISATSTMQNGATFTITRNDIPLFTSASTLSLQPGPVEGKDNWVTSDQPGDNYGVTGEMEINGGATEKSFMSEFDISSIPFGSRIVSAKLEMYLRYIGTPDLAAEFSVYPMTQYWVEGTGDYWDPGDGANWNTSDGSTAWTWSDTHSLDPVAKTLVNPAFVGWHSWDIKSLVQQWVSGKRTNFGLVIKGNSSVTSAGFYSSDYNTLVTLRPKLTITYGCECGVACITPQGTGNILLVVNDVNLGSGDETIKAVLEQWGYAVTLIDDDASQADMDNAVAVNDVAYITYRVDKVKLGSKLTGTAIGVVYEQGDLNSEIGMADSTSLLTSETAIDLLDTDHKITRFFPNGVLRIKQNSAWLSTTSGSVAAGIQTLAENGGGPALATLEEGVSLQGGSNASGRRVMLPIAGFISNHWNNLNNNGRLMVQQAIQWASEVSAGELLLVVTDPANLTAQESIKKSLLESWSFNVNLIDDDDSQATFDTAIATNDLVYIPEDIDENTLGNKLVSASIGIVIEETNLSDEFGLASTISWESEDSLSIMDNNFHVTQPFALENINLLYSASPMAYADGTLSPDLGLLGDTTTGSGLMTLDAGASTYNGGVAAGRRIQLPWGDNNFDIYNLTDNGLNILQRSLEWAGGEGCGSFTPLLLMVSDAVTPTMQEVERQTLIETWCYGVTLIDDDSTSANYVAALSNNDVVYISQEITNFASVPELVNASIGIVNEEQLLGDDFGLSSGSGTVSFNDINLLNNTHFITLGFGLGTLPLFEPATELYSGLSFIMAPGLRVLGFNGSLSLIATMEQEAELIGGGSALGRRIQVPWGNNFSALNVDGQTLMQRAIEWAATPKSPPLLPIAHWKLDDAAGTTAVDSEGGHNGSLINSPGWITGQLDGGIHLNGTSDYINVPHNDALSLTDTMTFMAWVKPTAIGSSYETVVNKGNGTANSNFWFGLWREEVVFGFYSGNTFREVWMNNTNIQAGNWYHIAATFDHSTKEVRLYLDGVMIKTEALLFSPTISTDDLTIGQSSNGQYWNGSLDDIRIYDSVLIDDEINDIFSTGAGSGLPDQVTCDGTYLDNFDDKVLDGSHGSFDWSSNLWSEVGETDGMNKGDIRITNDISNFQLQIKDNDNGGEGMERVANLSGSTTATLSFDYRRKSLDNSVDYVSVYISSTGSAPWSELDQIGITNDANYLHYSRDITSYASSTTTIRLLSSPDLGDKDIVFFDNFQILCIP